MPRSDIERFEERRLLALAARARAELYSKFQTRHPEVKLKQLGDLERMAARNAASGRGSTKLSESSARGAALNDKEQGVEQYTIKYILENIFRENKKQFAEITFESKVNTLLTIAELASRILTEIAAVEKRDWKFSKHLAYPKAAAEAWKLLLDAVTAIFKLSAQEAGQFDKKLNILKDLAPKQGDENNYLNILDKYYQKFVSSQRGIALQYLHPVGISRVKNMESILKNINSPAAKATGRTQIRNKINKDPDLRDDQKWVSSTFISAFKNGEIASSKPEKRKDYRANPNYKATLY